MKKSILLFVLTVIIIVSSSSVANIIHVPTDCETIQAGISAATDGDTVLVASGEYHERITLSGKTIILGSWFLTTADTSYITQTVIDGGNRNEVIFIANDVGPATTIIGFTIRNADDGIAPEAKFNLLNNRIINCKDGIDYEEYSGGICRNNIFENNRDDGIDLDDFVDIIIEDNIIRNNHDDGIEIRLHDYTGPLLTYTIHNNIIYGNGEDGIQLIDYHHFSNRVFYIERNLIFNNAMAGLGCMSNENSNENYEGGSIREPIYLFNNTFINNNHGVTGGDRLVALNNLIMNTEATAMKNVDGNSIVAYGCFWQNGLNFDNSNINDTTFLYANPLLDENFNLTGDSPCIDGGISFFLWQGDTVLNYSPANYVGPAPDIGAFEYGLAVGIEDKSLIPVKFGLEQNYPNPFNPTTTIQFQIGSTTSIRIEIFNIVGQKVRTLSTVIKSLGKYSISWDGTDDLGNRVTSGIYLYQLCINNPSTDGEHRFSEAKKMVLLR